MASKKIVSTGVNLPKFRYLDDMLRFIKSIGEEIKDTGEIIKIQQKTLAYLLQPRANVQAALTFEIAPTDLKQQRSLIRKMRATIDPTLTKIIVPSISKLKSQYVLAEDLYEKHRTLEAMETQLAMQFPDRRGDSYSKAEGALHELKNKVADQLKSVLGFLNEVAEKHVPKSFEKYMEAVADLVSEEVVFKDSQLFLYVSVNDEGHLVFSYYLMLVDAINDEGETTPNLYISVQWVVGDDGGVYVQLNHEYEVPNKLLRSGGTEVSTAGEAVKTISELLAIEQFSTSLGSVPIALQLKVDPSLLSSDMFSYRDVIKSISVDDTSISFTLRKEADSPEVLKTVSMQLYKEIKSLVKGKDAKVLMKVDKVGHAHVIQMVIKKIAQGGEINSFDVEFMRDKFDLSDAQLRKITNILNQQGR